MEDSFQRIERLPPYIFSITDTLKREAVPGERISSTLVWVIRINPRRLISFLSWLRLFSGATRTVIPSPRGFRGSVERLPNGTSAATTWH